MGSSFRSPPGGETDYPVMIPIGGWRCLVVGGGPVATRRVAGLLDAGATVTVVAPEVDAALERMEAVGLAVERRPYNEGEAAAYDLVVTATGVESVDRLVVADARSARALVASADTASSGTVRLPAVHRAGPVTVAVATGGASPAVAGWLRDRLASAVPHDMVTVVALAEEGRTELRASGRATHEVAWSVLLDEILPLIESGQVEEARAVVHRHCGPVAGPSSSAAGP
jgi:siroheme synthase-like protein